LNKIERFSQPNNWFKRRFTGRLDKEIDAETGEENVGSPACLKWRDDFSDGKHLGGREGDIVSQQDENAENEAKGSPRTMGLNPERHSDQGKNDAGEGDRVTLSVRVVVFFMETSSHVRYLPTGRQRQGYFVNLFYGTEGGVVNPSTPQHKYGVCLRPAPFGLRSG
jgi:hypothetical protein